MKSFSLFLLRLALWIPICCLGNQWPIPPTTISTPGVDASSPSIAVDPHGNVVAVWLENGFVISRSDVVKGIWTSPATTVSGSVATSPQLVIDPNGNATAIWIENGVVNTATLPLNGSWQAPVALSASGASSPQIGVDSSGNLVAVWNQGGVIMSSIQLFGGSWSVTPATISDSGASLPSLDVSAGGDMVCAWQGTADSVPAVFAATGQITGSWGSSQTISSAGVNSVYPQVAIDPNGDIVAAWFRYVYASNQYSSVVVQSASQPAGQSWEAPVDVSPPGIKNPADLVIDIAYSGNTNPVLVWTSSYDGSLFNIEWAISNSGTWTVYPSMIYNNETAYDVDVAVDIAGNVYLVWMCLYSSTSSIAIEGSMSALQSFESFFWTRWTLSAGGNNGYPYCVANGNPSKHYGGLVWLNNNGANNQVQAITTGLTILQPPSSPSVVQKTNDFGVVTEYYNVVSWNASPSINLWGYTLLRNNLSLTQVDFNTLQYTDLNQDPTATVTYQISAIDNNGFQSSWISVTYP